PLRPPQRHGHCGPGPRCSVGRRSALSDPGDEPAVPGVDQDLRRPDAVHARASRQIGATKGLFREGLQNAPILDVRRIFARSVTTLRTMGGPGWPRGALPAGRARHREPRPGWAGARYRRADTPAASAWEGDTAGRTSALRRRGRTAAVGALMLRSGARG